MNHMSVESAGRNRWNLAAAFGVGLGLLYLASRLYNLTLLPVFIE